AGKTEMGISVRNRKGGYYVSLTGDHRKAGRLVTKLFRSSYMSSGWGGELTFRLSPDSEIQFMLLEMEIDPKWLKWNNATVVSLARGIRESRDFARLRVLADALEEAGCANKEILAHCRESAPHEGSCWVVDLLLGESK